MNSIQLTYVNALLADASYVTPTAALDSDALKARMTDSQAAYLAANFEVVSSEISPTGGFDAVVWKIKRNSALAGPNNADAGKVFISMRGTQGLQDIADDLFLASKGLPYQQIADMVNWWLRSTATTDNTNVKQIKVIDLVGRSGYQTFALAQPATGTGQLQEVSSIAGVNGHSLGGYLATAFTRIFGTAFAVDKVSTFNSAGFSNAMTFNIEAEYNNIASLLGGGMDMAFASITSKQTNLFGQNGINFTTNSAADIGLPGFNQYGQRVDLYQEEGSAFANHSMYKLTDLLALGATLEKLDPTLSIAKLNALVRTGSNLMAGSYEGVLDALRKSLTGPAIQLLTASDTSDAPARTVYHATLATLQANPIFQELAGTLRIESPPASVATLARYDFGALIALQDLSPLYVSGTTAAAREKLAEIWQAGRASDYAAWLTDKTAAAPSTFTDSWMRDRAALLQAIVLRNQNDITSGIVANGGFALDRVLDIQYSDPADAMAKTLTAWNPSANPAGNALTTRDKQRIAFGGDANDTLTGTNNKLGDHLYGGADADTLNGLGGNDYLEGGTGNDTYVITPNSGRDTLLDTDGLGSIVLAGRTLTGAGTLQASAATGQNFTQWVDNSNPMQSITYHLDASHTLTITGAGSSVSILNFSSGQLGINTPQAPVPAAPPVAQSSYNLSTDAGLNLFAVANTPASTQNLLVQDASSPFNITGSTTNPVWRSVGEVRTGSGDDIIEGGIVPAVSNTLLAAGAGNDRIYAGVTATLADAISRGDASTGIVVPGTSRVVMDGGAGADQLIGGDAADVLFGGAGDDTLVGGQGGDIIIADGNAGAFLGGAGSRYTEGLIVGSNDTASGAPAQLRIDHAGVTAGWSGHDATGRYVVTASSVDMTVNPLYSVDFVALGQLANYEGEAGVAPLSTNSAAGVYAPSVRARTYKHRSRNMQGTPIPSCRHWGERK